MIRGAFKICTLLLVLFLAAPPAFCIHCCCITDEAAAAPGEASHGCCTKPKDDASLQTLSAKSSCDCPDLYEPMVATAAGVTADSCAGSHIDTTALIASCVNAARPVTADQSHQSNPPPEVERRQRASAPARAPPAVSV